ncbi:MAG: oligosaccharide flippase family protein, partial [Polyangiales bacterium]
MTDSALTEPVTPIAGEGARPTRVARNVATTIVTQLLTWAMSFAVVLYLPAYLGPSGMGKLSLATAIATVFLAIIPLGTSTVLVKEVAREPRRALSLLATSLMLRLPLSVLALALAYGVARAMRLDGELTTLVLVSVGGAIFSVANDAVVSTLQGLEEMPRQNAVAIIEKLVLSCLTIAVVVAHGRLWQIVIVAWVSSALATVCNLSAFWKDIRIGARVRS